MTHDDLRLLQSLPLEDKIRKSQLRIREWYNHWGGSVYISFSGGKDSTVLLHLIREQKEGLLDWKPYPDVPAVFCDTGLEYPEIRDFVSQHDDVTVIRPVMSFRDVLEKYGYPVISKETAKVIREIRTTKSDKLRDSRLNGAIRPNGERSNFGILAKQWRFLLDSPFKISDSCCTVMKKRPFKIFEKESGLRMMTGELAMDSKQRESAYLERGCNGFDMTRPKSTPIAFWTEQDILRYLQEYKVPYASVYGDIVERDDGSFALSGLFATGCMFCMFGIHRDGPINRFVRMQQTHPKLHDYCINKLGLGKVLDYMQIPYTSIFEEATT